MRKAAALLFLVAAPALADGAFDLEPGTKVLAPIRYKQLALMPVVKAAGATVDATRYMTLAEGLKSGLVAVNEAPGGGQVNRVHVANKSDRPLLLLGGEVILGGQQDRVLGKDTILERRSEADLEVFCVEHGRWSGAGAFTGAGGLAENKIRLRAKFRSDQGQVWAEVAEKNRALGAAPSTGTYRNVAVGGEGERAIKSARDFFRDALGKLPEQKQMVGMVAAVNGRVTSVDVFASPELFASYRDNLLDALLVSVADVHETAAAANPIAGADVKAFVDQAKKAKPKEAKHAKGSTTYTFDDPAVEGSMVMPEAPAAKPVYQSYQRNE